MLEVVEMMKVKHLWVLDDFFHVCVVILNDNKLYRNQYSCKDKVLYLNESLHVSLKNQVSKTFCHNLYIKQVIIINISFQK
jgi:hypothetical protein